MEKFIHSYLSNTYYIETSDVGNDGIYEKADTRRWKAPINGDRLLKELVLIFYIDEVQLKNHVEDWAKTIKSDVDLDWFWKQFESLMPIAQKIAAQTIGLDLVAVQPLSGPKLKLMFLDFKYSADTEGVNYEIDNPEVE